MLGLIIYGIVLLVTKQGTKKENFSTFEKQEDSAMEILKERLDLRAEKLMKKNLKSEKNSCRISTNNSYIFTNLLSILLLSSRLRRKGEKEMQLKKVPFVLSFALSSLLMVTQPDLPAEDQVDG